MKIMNCCDYCWEPQPPGTAQRVSFAGNCFSEAPFVPDYVYNPKEARIRKAMRDQANRARAINQQSQRQHQQVQHLHHHNSQPHHRPQHSLLMEGRNDMMNHSRMNSMARQVPNPNIQPNHKVSHLIIPQHVLQHTPSHIQLQQVNHNPRGEVYNQQWMVGQRPVPQHHQHNMVLSQEQHFNKRKAAIREQVEHGLLDGNYELIDVQTFPHTNARVIEVNGRGAGDGLNERNATEERGVLMGSEILLPNRQEFTIITDSRGQQHWYSCVPGSDIKQFNGGPMNNWNHHQEQQSEQRIQQHHLPAEGINIKLEADDDHLYHSQVYERSETSLQEKAEQGAGCSYQRLPLLNSEVKTNIDESLQGQQYVVTTPTTSMSQVKLSLQPNPEMESSKENTGEIDSSHSSIPDAISSAVNTINNISNSDQEDVGQRNPDLVPLPAFQQAFGSTEIGRFANEGFLSQVRVSLAVPSPSQNFPISSSSTTVSHQYPHNQTPIHHNYSSNYGPQHCSSQSMVNAFPCTYQHHQQLRPWWECQRDLPIRH